MTGACTVLTEWLNYFKPLPRTTPAWGGEVVAIGGKVAMMPISLGTADFMVHHIHAFSADVI